MTIYSDLHNFAAKIARMETASEVDERTDGDGMSGDDAVETLSSLIRDARTLIRAEPRYVIQPEHDVTMRDDYGKRVGPLEPGVIPETEFRACEDANADHWAVYEAGDPFRDSVLIDDFPSRAAAEAWILKTEEAEITGKA